MYYLIRSPITSHPSSSVSSDRGACFGRASVNLGTGRLGKLNFDSIVHD